MTGDPATPATAIQGIPLAADGPTFREPWEAQAFAMAVALQQRGVFTWTEWAEALGQEIRRAQQAGDPDTGETYYRHWLAALERIIATKQLSDGATLRSYSEAWKAAARRTPHGTPIELTEGDFRRRDG